MKKLLVLAMVVFGFAMMANAQAPKKPLSPKDSVEIKTNAGVNLKIVYCRPSLRGREITTMVPFGKVWRTGANAVTVFQVDKDVTIGGKALPAGKYGFYTIPGSANTTLIFNKIWDQWGTKYDEASDFLRVDVPTKMSKDKVEEFTIKAKKSGEVKLLWSNWDITFDVKKG